MDQQSIFNLSQQQWAIALFCAFLIGFAKSGIAGTGILMVPLMASVFPAAKSTGILLPLLVVGDIFALSYYRRHAVWTHVLRCLPWAILGIIAGWAMVKFYLQKSADASSQVDNFLRVLIGIIVLGVLGLGIWVERIKTNAGEETGERSHPNSQWWFAAIFGLLGGFTTMVANAAGPVWVVYLLAMGLPKNSFLGTGAWMFFILNTFKLPLSHNLGFITTDSLWFDLKMIPPIAAGTVIGIYTVKVLPQGVFIYAVKLLAVTAALNLLGVFAGFRSLAF